MRIYELFLREKHHLRPRVDRHGGMKCFNDPENVGDLNFHVKWLRFNDRFTP